MQQDVSQLTPLQHDDLPELTSGVCFDGDNIRLEGQYIDQLSAYRARKIWKDVLATYFLLETELDVAFKIHGDMERGTYSLRCDFQTACARYAFWRLTNGQTPEAQYLIETAHIPECESRRYDFLTATDLKPMERVQPSILNSVSGTELRQSLNRLLKRIRQVLRS